MLAARAATLGSVLDLYAGSGALGIEALSRGAEHADFVEQNARQCHAIRENLGLAELSGLARVYCGRVQTILTKLEGPYDVVFLDPPYGDALLPGLMEKLGVSPILTEQSIVVVERSTRQVLGKTYGRISLVRELRHGDTTVSVYTSDAKQASKEAS